MRGVTPFIVTLVLMALLLPTSIASSPTPDTEDATSAGWAAPLDFTGDIVIRFTIDFGEENHCQSLFAAASDNPEGGVRYRGQGAHFGTTSWQSQPATLHDDENIDSRDEVQLGGGGGIRVSSTGPLSGVHNVSMTVFNAYAIDADSDDPRHPLQWAVDCDNPIEITNKTAGLEAFGFTQRTMDGTGASANAFVAAASVNIDGHANATFTEPDVALDWFSYGNLDGTLQIEGDDQTKEWDLSQTSSSSYSGGPGDYSITLDRTGADMFDDLVGIFTATAPVQEFDEVFDEDL